MGSSRDRPPRSEGGPSGRFATGPQDAALSGQGQGVHRPVHVRGRQPGRHVRPQAGAQQAQRQADSNPGPRSGAEGSKPGDVTGVVPQVREARPGGDRGLRPYPEPGPVRRRPGGHPEHAYRQLRARLGPAPDEHGIRSPGVSEPGFLGDLRAGDGQQQLAGLRRSARPPRRADLRPSQLGRRLHAGDLSGYPVPHQRRSDLEPPAAAGESRPRSSATSSTSWPG